MKDCALGFIFDSTLEYVLLVYKNSPAWQAGKINGVGGKTEPGETAVACMVRECQEETTLVIRDAAWASFAHIKETQKSDHPWMIEVFAAKYDGPTTDAKQNDHEEIEWFPYQAVPDNAISNLHFLIPLARQKLLGHDSKSILITY